MIHLRSLPATLLAVCGTAMAVPGALACTQRHDYPMNLIEATRVDASAVGFGTPWGYVRYEATLVVDAAMKADLEASAAAGCQQTLSGHVAYGSLSTVQYATAGFDIHTTLTGSRPGKTNVWWLAEWHDSAALGKFGGTFAQSYAHDAVAPVKAPKRARVGDVVQLWSGGLVQVNAFGDNSQTIGEAHYHWGDLPPIPVISIWLP